MIQRVSYGNSYKEILIYKTFILDMLDTWTQSKRALSACVGVMLLGTPNRGTKFFDSNGSLLAAIAAETSVADSELGTWMESQALKDLQDSQGVLSLTSSDFARLCISSRIKVVCFYEGRSSPVKRLVEGSDMQPVSTLSL